MGSVRLANELLDTMREILEAEGHDDVTDVDVARELDVPRQHVSRARKRGIGLALARKWARTWAKARHAKIRFIVGGDDTDADRAEVWAPGVRPEPAIGWKSTPSAS